MWQMRMFGNESKRACSISLFGLWSFSDLGVRLGSRIFVDFVDWIGLGRGGLGRGLDLDSDLDVDWILEPCALLFSRKRMEAMVVKFDT